MEKQKTYLELSERERRECGYPEMPTDPIVLNAVSAFLGWVEHHNVKFIESEKVVYSKMHNYVGTMDAVAEVDGELCVVDFKTSNALYPEYNLQVCAYLQADQEEMKFMKTPRKYKGWWLVRFGKENKFDEETKQNYVEFEAVKKEMIEFDNYFNAFKGALAVYRWKFQEEKKKELKEKFGIES